jgi:hypothetical protein
VALADDDRVAGAVVERRGRAGVAAGRGAERVHGAGAGDEVAAEAGRADPQRPVDVLDVGEQRVVERAGGGDRRARDGHQRADGAGDRHRVAGEVHVGQRRAVAGRPARVAAAQPEALARPLHPAVLEEQHPGQDAGVGALLERVREGPQDVGVGDRVVVEQHDPVGAVLDRAGDRRVVAAAVAEVRAVLDHDGLRMRGADRGDAAVGRPVVGDVDRVLAVDRAQRRQAAQRVLAAVPVEDHERPAAAGRRRGHERPRTRL